MCQRISVSGVSRFDLLELLCSLALNPKLSWLEQVMSGWHRRKRIAGRLNLAVFYVHSNVCGLLRCHYLRSLRQAMGLIAVG